MGLVGRALLFQLLVEELFGLLEAPAAVGASAQGRRRLVTSGVAELGVFGRVGRLGIGEHRFDCVVDGRLGAVGRHRRVGGHLGPVESDDADGGHPGRGAQPQRGREDGLEGSFVTLAEPGDRRVVEKEPGQDHPEPHVDMTRPLDLSGTANAEAVGVDEEGDRRLWVMGRSSPAVLAVVGIEGPQVHLLDAVEDEPRQVVLRQPLRERWRQQVELIALWGDEVVGHRPNRRHRARSRGGSHARATRDFADRAGGSRNRLHRGRQSRRRQASASRADRPGRDHA